MLLYVVFNLILIYLNDKNILLYLK